MKGYLFLLIGVLLLSGCSTMEDALSDSTGDLIGGAIKSSVTDSVSGGDSSLGKVDFKKDEILASTGRTVRDDATYRVAKFLTKPSAETNNQGEFIFIKDGETLWTPLFFETRIPDKNELEIGMTVFWCDAGRANFSGLTQDSYRNGYWYIGRITSVEDLFKNELSVDGTALQLLAVRVAVDPWD